jgi:predicted P-loop ATPase
LASVAENVNANRRNKHKITSVFSAEKLNGNSAKQLLSLVFIMGKHHREPIKHTCPDIDKLIKGQTEIMKLIRNYQKIDEVEDFKDIISDIENILWDFDNELEKLRSSNDTLRDWGISEAEEVDKLEDKIYALENE